MTGEIISGTGMWISIIGSMKFMQHLIPSDFIKSLVLMFPYFFSILLAPKAGAIIDQYDKGKVLFWATVLRCVSPISMLFAIYYDSIFCIILSGLAVQCAASFFIPANYATIPHLVKPSELLQANSIFLNTTTLARIGGAAIGGILVATFDLVVIYTVAFFAYIYLAVISLRLNIPKTEKKSATSQDKVKFFEVFRLIKNDAAITLGLINALMITVFIGGLNLIVINFSEMLHSPEVMGYIYTAEGSSILLAGLLTKKWFSKHNLVNVSTVFVFLFATSLIGLSMAQSTSFLLFCFALYGFSIGIILPINTTIYQNQLSSEIRGRFFSFKTMTDRILFQISLLITGVSLDVIGVSTFSLILGLVSILVGALSLWYSRVNELDIRQPTETKVA